MPWYGYAFLTPLFYSFSNYLDKFLLEKKIRNPFAMTVVSGVASGCIGLIIWGLSGFRLIGFLPTALMFLAGLLLIFYLLPYFAALKAEDASTIVPMFQFIPVFTLVLSSVFLNETLTGKQTCGLLLVIVAGVLISLRRIEKNIFRPRKALLFMLMASFLYGSIGVLFRFVVRDVNFWTTFAYEYMGTGLGALLLLSLSASVRRTLHAEKKALLSSVGIISFNNAICILAQLAESFAMSLVAVPLVNIVGSIQPLMVFIEGILLTLFFPHIVKENISRGVLLLKSSSIVLMLSGLFLVYG